MEVMQAFALGVMLGLVIGLSGFVAVRSKKHKAAVEAAYERARADADEANRLVMPAEVRAFRALLDRGLLHHRQEGDEIAEGLSVQDVPEGHSLVMKAYLRLGRLRARFVVYRDGSLGLSFMGGRDVLALEATQPSEDA